MTDLRSVGALASAVRATQADLDRLIEARNRAVVELRLGGASLGELAAAMQISRSGVQAILRSRPEWERRIAQRAEDVRSGRGKGVTLEQAVRDLGLDDD